MKVGDIVQYVRYEAGERLVLIGRVVAVDRSVTFDVAPGRRWSAPARKLRVIER